MGFRVGCAHLISVISRIALKDSSVLELRISGPGPLNFVPVLVIPERLSHLVLALRTLMSITLDPLPSSESLPSSSGTKTGARPGRVGRKKGACFGAWAGSTGLFKVEGLGLGFRFGDWCLGT